MKLDWTHMELGLNTLELDWAHMELRLNSYETRLDSHGTRTQHS